jgi:hypothetical protein
MGFFRRKAEAYRAAVHVEKYRAAAVAMRESDPTLYAEVLSQADGSEAEGAAHRDPDAYVALFLATYEEEERANPSTMAPTDRDVDHWPTLDFDAVWAQVTETFHVAVEDRGAAQLYPPRFTTDHPFGGWEPRSTICATLCRETPPSRAIAESETPSRCASAMARVRPRRA